ncbi:hypothetical protein [Pseudonocardia sp. KRD291]|uniref:hypothetical protein n=1 Tax=Pseudonocardia sp. KRD291 TaxID=2792007 RepID=UPI001C4A717D|nr:hypothetical protein [Pseudonocardia sp. KRD291]MBW0104316.1 hypothetical protein [Pseudonocardia sp. KRD291]
MEPSTPAEALSLANLDIGAWSADEGLAFETAEWIIGALISRVSADTAAERDKPAPDQHRLGALAEERARYAAVRRQLSVHDPAHVQEVLRTYGKLARQRGLPGSRSAD